MQVTAQRVDRRIDLPPYHRDETQIRSRSRDAHGVVKGEEIERVQPLASGRQVRG